MFKFPRTPPTFTSVDEERQHRKQRLAAAFRIFSRFGFDEGVAGHATVRDPENPEHFWVNPFGLHFGQLRASDLLLVDTSGRVLQGQGAVNLAAFAIHSQIHAARPDVQAAAHMHSLYGKTFSALRQPLAPLTQDACVFFEDHAVYDGYSGVVTSQEEGQRIAAALGRHKAAILCNHGLLTVGATVDEAAWWYVTMERSCQAELLARAAGEPRPIPPEGARAARGIVGTPLAGWFGFQPLWDRIVREQPDLLG
jgi:ribulose-5-phosphate 4-epimerase/fuculose-1-phosphate aldolase